MLTKILPYKDTVVSHWPKSSVFIFNTCLSRTRCVSGALPTELTEPEAAPFWCSSLNDKHFNLKILTGYFSLVCDLTLEGDKESALRYSSASHTEAERAQRDVYL